MCRVLPCCLAAFIQLCVVAPLLCSCSGPEQIFWQADRGLRDSRLLPEQPQEIALQVVDALNRHDEAQLRALCNSAMPLRDTQVRQMIDLWPYDPQRNAVVSVGPYPVSTLFDSADVGEIWIVSIRRRDPMPAQLDITLQYTPRGWRIAAARQPRGVQRP